MKKQKFKIRSWDRKTRDEINIKQEIFFALTDKRYLNRLSSNAREKVIETMSFNQYKYFLKKNRMYKKPPTNCHWTDFLDLSIERLKNKKEKELKKNFKNNFHKDPKRALKQALVLLNTAFTLNKNVKQKAYSTFKCCNYGCSYCGYSGYHTDVDYTLRDSEYKEKTKIIKKIINLIKNNLLPIKYGKNDEIVYFEYLGSQVSFHDPKNQIKNCKKFKGVWTGTPNKKIPFPLTNKQK